MTTQRTAGPALPLKIVYNTDYYDPEPEDLATRYIVSIQDANEKTVVFTDSGYFKLDQGVAEYLVRACNVHDELVKIAKAYRNLLKTSAQTEGEVVTYHYIEDVLALAEGK